MKQKLISALIRLLFKNPPKNKAGGAFLEIGEWDGKQYQLETDADIYIGPDGYVWISTDCLAEELPAMQ